MVNHRSLRSGPVTLGGVPQGPHTRVQAWCLRVGMALCAFLVAALMIQALLISSETFNLRMQMRDDLEDRASNSSYFVHGTRRRDYADRNDTAYVFLSLGAQTVQLNCFSAIETLVRIGGWGGDVYVITDRPECWGSHLLDWVANNAEMDRARLHLVSTGEDLSSGGVDFIHPTRGFRARRSDSFAMKARIFEFLPPHVKVIAYADCDILFGKPGCPVEFLEESQQQSSWQEGHLKVREGVHLGSFIAHREYSAEAMRLWRERMKQMTDEGDNDAYIAMYEELEEKKRLTGEPNPNPMAVGPISPTFERFIVDDPHIFCLNHISKARCSGLGRETVQNIVNRFRLKTYEHKYPYCPHPIIQPLLYGYVPWRYLGCPKVEKWL